MMRTLLLLDVSNLAHRNFHVLGDLSYEGVQTGTTFGLFRDILNFQEIHYTKRIIFCFDSPPYLRKKIFDGYKQRKKKEQTDEETRARSALFQEIERFRDHHLPAIGFKNIFWQEGFEADDIIASVCKDLEADEEAIIIGTDNDLFQLLSDWVLIWNPHTKKSITKDSFVQTHGIKPWQWGEVKSIAGCSSDNIPGVPGVGEKTAIKYLKNQLKPYTKVWMSIERSSELILRNYKLTRLPFPGVKHFRIEQDEVTRTKWKEVIEKLGMKSLFGRI